MDCRPAGPVRAESLACFHGLWERTAVEEPIGTPLPSAVRVFWLQTDGAFCDLRLPSGQAEAEQSGGDRLDEWRATVKGFAGECFFTTNGEANADTLTWRRSLDVQPPTGCDDVGLVSFVDTAKRTLLEYGVVGDDYKEVWERVGDAPDGRWLTLVLSDDSDCRGQLIVCADKFVLVVDARNPPLAQAASLSALAGTRDDLYNYTLWYGRATGTSSHQQLHIELSAPLARTQDSLLSLTITDHCARLTTSSNTLQFGEWAVKSNTL